MPPDRLAGAVGQGSRALYAAGVRTFVEVGPKQALKGFVDDVLGDKADVVVAVHQPPAAEELASFNQALCGLYAAGYGAHASATVEVSSRGPWRGESRRPRRRRPASRPACRCRCRRRRAAGSTSCARCSRRTLESLPRPAATRADGPYDRNDVPLGSIVISGTGLGLPGANKAVMDPDNAVRILRGEQFVDLIPSECRKGMARQRITRLVKRRTAAAASRPSRTRRR